MTLNERFPFPFETNTFQYSNNLRPLAPPNSVLVTSKYTEELALKRTLLAQNHAICYQSQPSTGAAQWEICDHVLHELSEIYPQHFALRKNGLNWTFTNFLLHETHRFVFGDTNSLGMEPLDFVGRQVQEDLILMTQQEDELYLDAGQLCFPSNWSLVFDLGMSFKDIHQPVPGLVDRGLAAKIERFLVRVEAGKPWTRLNWSLSAGSRLNTSAETFTDWGGLRYQVHAGNVGSLIHLRVEEQKLLRMPSSQSLLFTIHTHLQTVADVALNPEWCEVFYHVLQSIPDEVAEYKGIAPYKETLLIYLKNEMIRHGR